METKVMKTLSFLISLLFCLIVVFSGCKKKSDDTNQTKTTRIVSGSVQGAIDPSQYSITSFRGFTAAVNSNGAFNLEVSDNNLPQYVFLLNNQDSLIALSLIKPSSTSFIINGKSTANTIVFVNVLGMGCPSEKVNDQLIDYIDNLPEIVQLTSIFSNSLQSGNSLKSVLTEETFSVLRTAITKTFDYVTNSKKGTQILEQINTYINNKNNRKEHDPLFFKKGLKEDEFSQTKSLSRLNGSGFTMFPENTEGIHYSGYMNQDGTCNMTIDNTARRHVDFHRYEGNNYIYGLLGPGKHIVGTVLGKLFDDSYSHTKTVTGNFANGSIYLETLGPGGWGGHPSGQYSHLDPFYVLPYCRTMTSLSTVVLEPIFSCYLGEIEVGEQGVQILAIFFNYVQKEYSVMKIGEELNKPNPDYFKIARTIFNSIFQDDLFWQEIKDKYIANLDIQKSKWLCSTLFSVIDMFTFLSDVWNLDEQTVCYVYNDTTIPPEVIPPTVEILSPTSSVEPNQIIPVTVHAKDDNKVTYLDFFIDNQIYDYHYIGSSATNEITYQFEWNTTGLTPGSTHYLSARAKDENDNIGKSQLYTIVVSGTMPSGQILPLSVGNYWTYLPDITTQTVTISITGTIDIQGETCYKWFAQGDQVEWYYKNKSDGCWAYGYSGPYQYPPDLEYKYPANSGDTWITNWIAVPVPTTMTCESTNVTFESYTGCYKYHFLLPMKKDNFCTNMFKNELLKKMSGLKTTATDGYDIYQYFVPGIGMVGWENYFQGTRLYKVVLTDYHLN